ncbi:MAG: Uma2 family endonuclease [Deltaproteobacteria bacterium]|nr:Uma2 family endonuclease [Deltaproteobacteria bacterium]
MSGDAARTLDPQFPRLDPAVVEGYRNAPEHLVAEIIDGQLSLMPRPRLRHAGPRPDWATASFTASMTRGRRPGRLDPPRRTGVAPRARPDVVIPDLGGWRRERVPEGFMDDAAATLAPDWCCEVLLPSTEQVDRGRKLDIYRREGVGHVWLVSPVLQTVEVLRRHDLGWLLTATFAGNVVVRAEPFDAVELDLAALWSV